MFLPLILSAVTFNPAMAPRMTSRPTEGYIVAQPVASETNCKPGHICASKKTTLHGCYLVNFFNGNQGATPLAIDVTQTGPAGSTTWVYWVNNYYKTIGITGNVMAKYYCPPST